MARAPSRRFLALLAVWTLAATAAATAPALATAAAGPAPKRVVSLNPCLDAILIEVADRNQIVALSHYAREPSQSAIAQAARGYPFTWGSAEEVAALRPDLVLISGTAGPALSAVLPRLHIRAASFAVPETVGDSLAQVRRVAALVGHADRGEALAARIETALAAATPRPGTPRLTALIYERHGFASGPGSLMDELMRRAGFDNAAPLYGLTQAGEVPLEALIAHPPRVLLAGALGPGEPNWADRVLSNPALKPLSGRVKREPFPEVLIFCGGPSMIAAAQALARARDDALRGPSR